MKLSAIFTSAIAATVVIAAPSNSGSPQADLTNTTVEISAKSNDTYKVPTPTANTTVGHDTLPIASSFFSTVSNYWSTLWNMNSIKSSAPLVVLPNSDTISGVAESKYVESFRGIPFAEPPVGDLRFRRPAAYSKSLDGFKADNYGPSCMAVHFLGILDPTKKYLEMIPPKYRPVIMDRFNVKEMDEDCLTINVLRPKETKPEDKLPVIAWIYGGAFQFGASSMYPGNKYIRDSIDMDQKVIFVSFNYRMGPWGFLGGQGINVEGSSNAGLFDQRLAFEWISENIASFGGDPNRVTAMGESAGAISIAHHLVSHEGDLTMDNSDKKLFQAAIFQSGGAWSFDAVNSSRANDAFNIFARNANCINPNEMDATVEIYADDDSKQNQVKAQDAKILKCLRQKGVEELSIVQNFEPLLKDTDVSAQVLGMSRSLNSWQSVFGFSPRFDGDLLAGNPMELLAQGKFAKDIPFITGNQEDEGTILASLFSFRGSSDANNLMKQMFEHATPEQYNEIINMYKEDTEEDSQIYGSPYNTPKSNEMISGYKRFASIVNDIMFQAPRRLHLQNTEGAVNRYVYQSTFLRNTPYFGTTHSAELAWQFYLDIDPAPSFRRYFISFAHHHNPNFANTGKFAGAHKRGLSGFFGSNKRMLEAWPQYTNQGKQTLNIGMSENVPARDEFARDANIQYFMKHPETIQI